MHRILCDPQCRDAKPVRIAGGGYPAEGLVRPAFAPPPVAAAGPAAYAGYSEQPSAGGYAPPAYADPHVSTTTTCVYKCCTSRMLFRVAHALVLCIWLLYRLLDDHFALLPLSGHQCVSFYTVRTESATGWCCHAELPDVLSTCPELPDVQCAHSRRCAR